MQEFGRSPCFRAHAKHAIQMSRSLPRASEGGCLIIVLMKVHSVAFGNSHLRASETVSGMNCLLIITVIRNEQCRAGAMLIYLFDAPLTGGEKGCCHTLVPLLLPLSVSFPKNLHKSRVADGVGHRIFLIIFLSFIFSRECLWLRDFSF